MRIQFENKREATRFAAAVVNVTGREPLMTRTECARWRVQSADLNHELAFAISSLLACGVPSQQVTLNEVAQRAESGPWEPQWLPTVSDPTRPATPRPLTPGQFTALRGMKQEALAAAAG